MSTMTAAVPQTVRKKRKKKSMFLEVMKRLCTNPVALIGMIVLLLLVLAAIFAPLIAPYDYVEMDFKAVKATPCAEHLLGCDQFGRDILSRCLYGARNSLSLGFASAITGVVCGLALGSLIGFIGGEVDMVCMRICDILTAIPGNLIAILLSTVLGGGFVPTIIAMTVGGIPHQIRGVRAMCLREREQEYLEAATAIGCRKWKIMYKHMLPNIISPSIVSTTMGIGGSIMGAAGLSYIGLGIQPPSPEWGAMISNAKSFVQLYPHMMLAPGICIAITVLATNMFGDGLRDALDPKLKK